MAAPLSSQFWCSVIENTQFCFPEKYSTIPKTSKVVTNGFMKFLTQFKLALVLLYN